MHAGGRTDAVLYGRRSAFAFAGHDRRLEGVLLAALSLQLQGCARVCVCVHARGY